LPAPTRAATRARNLSGVSSLAPPGQAAYVASKFAIRGFSECSATSLRVSGVGVTVVHPGGVATSIARNARAPAGVDADEIARGALVRQASCLPAEVGGKTIVRGVEERKPRVLVGRDAIALSVIEARPPVSYWKLLGRVLGATIGGNQRMSSPFPGHQAELDCPFWGREIERTRAVGSVDVAYDVADPGEAAPAHPGPLPSPNHVARGASAMRSPMPASSGSHGQSRRRSSSPHRGAAAGRPCRHVRSFLGLPSKFRTGLEEMAEDAFGLMHTLGHEYFHVVGASMGGMIAQTMAIMRAERLRTMTSIMSGPGGRRYAIGKLSALRALLSPVPSERDAQIERLMKTFRILNAAVDFRSTRLRRGCWPWHSWTVDRPRLRGPSLRRDHRELWKASRALEEHQDPDPRHPWFPRPLCRCEAGSRPRANIPGAELLVVQGMGHKLPAPVLPALADAIARHARKAAVVKPRGSARSTVDLPRAARALRALIKESRRPSRRSST